MHATADFLERIGDFDLTGCERSPYVAYGLDAKLRLAYMNPSWEHFALVNGSIDGLARWTLAAPVLEAVSPVIRVFYHEAFRRVLKTGETWLHAYEASSPDELRIFKMSVEAIGAPAERVLLVTNEPIVERTHDPVERRAKVADASRYRRRDGSIMMCCGCRRVRRSNNDGWWDWVASYLNEPPARADQGLCPACLELYYPDSDARANRRPRASEVPLAFTRHG